MLKTFFQCRCMRLVEELGFPLSHDLKLVALQGDCPLKIEPTAGGGIYAVDDRGRARQACLSLVTRARDVNAHLALIPELVIPKDSLVDLLGAMDASPKPLILIGGIEGIAPAEYRELVNHHGGTPDVPDGAPGTYVNSILVAIKTAAGLKAHFRAKRFASGPENRGGPQLAIGNGEFLVLKIGSVPFVIVPLICSELTWPELWATLEHEAPHVNVDLIPVLQRNDDPQRRYTGPVMHTAYQNNSRARFVLANQALLKGSDGGSDGTCFVVAPPATPPAPGFDHGRNELWLDGGITYKGFRIPERTGCFWYAEVAHPDGPMSAARPPVCGGLVLAVLTPPDVNLSGMPAGLMRSAAKERHLACGVANTEPKARYQSSLTAGASYILEGASQESAKTAFFSMICEARPTWGTVESIVSEFVEACALLACAGDEVRIAPCAGGNCTVSGRSVAVLYAPAVDKALEARFSPDKLLSGAVLPTGVVLLAVEASSRIFRANTLGDVLRADRVSSESPELSDSPSRVPESAVTINLGDIHFCEPRDLRVNLEEATLAAARNRSAQLLPGVYI
jgi:hypothetical protein